MSNWFTKVYKVTKTIPVGKVMTYGQVAKIIGAPTPRIVGFALHANKSAQVPCHRVVAKDGSLSGGFAFGGRDEHRYRLEQEGIEFTLNGKVIMEKYQI
jgi:methylated-DNA-protein-cysteine methyltransferase-like protein